MALNDLNKNAIAFKRLVGKTHTNQNFAYNEESVTSNVQMAYTTVFAQPILPEPATTSGLTNPYDTDGIVELLKFEVSIIPDTQIGTNQSQGYAIKLPSDYSTFGALKAIYSGGTFLNSALGRLQIVPALYGKLQPDGSTEYDPLLATSADVPITKFDPINWIIDTYSGILFVQTPPAGYDVSATKPAYVTAFLYVGQYLNDALTSGVTATVNVDNITIAQSGVTNNLYVIPDSIDGTRLKISTGSPLADAPLLADGFGSFKYGAIAPPPSGSSKSIIISTAPNVNLTTGDTYTLFVASGTTGFTLSSTPQIGTELTFADGIGNANTTPITVFGNGKSINGDTYALVNTNFGSFTINYNGFFWNVTGFTP
ncbi:MAG: hypothetical protein HC836_33020 [Richelia sp. RM2_1_2]|nr:hypothetical protein [Richelia sp. RM2_1_2]